MTSEVDAAEVKSSILTGAILMGLIIVLLFTVVLSAVVYLLVVVIHQQNDITHVTATSHCWNNVLKAAVLKTQTQAQLLSQAKLCTLLP